MEINSDSGHSQKMPLDTVKFRQVPKVKDQYLRLRITSLRTKPLGQDSLHTEMQTMGGVFFFLLKFDYKQTQGRRHPAHGQPDRSPHCPKVTSGICSGYFGGFHGHYRAVLWLLLLLSKTRKKKASKTRKNI